MPEYIKTKITSEKAHHILSSPPGLFRKKRAIDKIELFYLPSYIITVQVKTDKKIQNQSLCIDAVLGSFAFYTSSKTSSTPECKFSTCPFLLQEEAIVNMALEEYRRHLLHSGLKMRYRFQVQKVISIERLFYPFWIGYFSRKNKLDFDVVDAVGGEHQGVALRPVFIKALLEAGGS
ncbi:hypothetical protein EH223_16760 [candidate division KSB1 bacterium]|nr:MAG: hypothetical protein EH223_16760 [candidate division KSB1 bacterium]